MRTHFWTFTLAFIIFLLPRTGLISAQDLAQLKKTVEANTPKELPYTLGNKPPAPELVNASEKVAEAVKQIYALPDISIQDRYWALQREAAAVIVLARADAPSYYSRLADISDELERAGNRKLAQLVEKHVLEIGTVLATGPNSGNFPIRALAERMVLYAEQHPDQDSLKLIDNLLHDVRLMNAIPRDHRLAVIAPIFQDYYQRINHKPKAAALEPDIQRSTLVGQHMTLTGVDLNGKELDWLTLDGKVVLIQFWGTWCKNCNAEMPDLIALYEKYHGDGLEIIGVNTGVQDDRDEKKVKQFIETKTFNGKKIPWIILHEGLAKRQRPNQTTLTDFYGISELPVLILIGQNGRVLNLHPLPATLDYLIAEATSPLAAALEGASEEDKKQIEEARKKQNEETNQQIQKELENL